MGFSQPNSVIEEELFKPVRDVDGGETGRFVLVLVAVAACRLWSSDGAVMGVSFL